MGVTEAVLDGVGVRVNTNDVVCVAVNDVVPERVKVPEAERVIPCEAEAETDCVTVPVWVCERVTLVLNDIDWLDVAAAEGVPEGVAVTLVTREAVPEELSVRVILCVGERVSEID